MPRELERMTGRVERALVREGTASEHEAVVLRTHAGERVILQRVGGNPFEDRDTGDLVGRSVRVEGYRLGDVFRYVKAESEEGP